MVSQKHFATTTALTITVSFAWIASIVARIMVPSWPAGAGIDSAMLLVLGYWFSINAARRNGRKEDK